MNYTDTTPIAILTVADLKTILADLVKPVEPQKREPSGFMSTDSEAYSNSLE